MKFVIRSSMLRGSRMKVGRVTRERSAPGRSCEMMWERTLPCSVLTTSTSSPGSLSRGSSADERLLARLVLWWPSTILGGVVRLWVEGEEGYGGVDANRLFRWSVESA